MEDKQGVKSKNKSKLSKIISARHGQCRESLVNRTASHAQRQKEEDAYSISASHARIFF